MIWTAWKGNTGGDPTEPRPDHDEYPDCAICAGRGEIMHDTDPHTWQPCEACGGNGFINAAPPSLAGDTADRSPVGESPRPEGSPTRAHSGSRVSAALVPRWQRDTAEHCISNLLEALTNAAAALRYCQASLPVGDPLARKVEVTEAAARAAIAKANGDAS